MAKAEKKEKARKRENGHDGNGKTAMNGNGGNGAMRDPASVRELIAGLNEDLSWEFNAIISYRLFASLCTGPYRPELRQFFEAEIPDEMGHATLLSDKIVSLGGTPITIPAPVEITTDNRRMLELALKAERETIQRYKERAHQAESLGETGLKVRLEDIIVDETHHAEEIERILVNWKS